jgi:hypothetical protein
MWILSYPTIGHLTAPGLHVARGDWVTINYFDCFWTFELIVRKVVLACESLIHKGKSSASTIHKYMGVNFDITVGQGTQYD